MRVTPDDIAAPVRPVRPALTWRQRYDLALLLGAALLPPLLLLFPPELALLRAPAGLVLVLLAPGYALQAALFPRRADLDGVARLGLSFGLSVALLPLLALLLDALPWGIRPWPMALALTAWIGGGAGVALVQRWRLSPPEVARRAAGPRARQVQWLSLAGGMAGGALLIAGLALVFLPPPAPRLTEFYALGRQGLAEDYPRQAVAGEALAVTLGIDNREGRAISYGIAVVAGGDRLAAVGPIALAAGATWRQPVLFALPAAGADQPVDILLYADDGAEPYRRLRLWIDVRETP